ncbi:MAG: hypothetical protein Q8N53_20850, partial [Longimicrobiales bacterium]|nr:hypothetical protein [Longimicrobiales bacterium]
PIKGDGGGSIGDGIGAGAGDPGIPGGVSAYNVGAVLAEPVLREGHTSIRTETYARLVEENVGTRDEPERQVELRFDVAHVPARGNLDLHGIGLDGEAAGFRRGASGGYSYVGDRLHAGLVLREGEPIPRGIARVWVRSASVFVRGPWRMTWTVPGTEGEAVRAAPVTLHLESARQRRGDLTLRADNVVLSDRLTAVTLALEGAPGVALSAIPYWDAAAQQHGPTLGDDRGGAYRPGLFPVAWRPTGGSEPAAGTYTFGPVQPLARRLTLHVPGVQVAIPGSAALYVEVPPDVTLTASGADRPWLASAPWDVGIVVEIAGYRLRFTEACLQEGNGTTLLRLLSEPYTPRRQGRWLSSLQLEVVTGPGGRQVGLETALSAAGPGEAGAEHRAVLLFDVVNPATGAVQPGRYHVELKGVTEAVRGPWELTWDLAAR